MPNLMLASWSIQACHITADNTMRVNLARTNQSYPCEHEPKGTTQAELTSHTTRTCNTVMAMTQTTTTTTMITTATRAVLSLPIATQNQPHPNSTMTDASMMEPKETGKQKTKEWKTAHGHEERKR